jgi:hypothetical protein
MVSVNTCNSASGVGLGVGLQASPTPHDPSRAQRRRAPTWVEVIPFHLLLRLSTPSRLTLSDPSLITLVASQGYLSQSLG